MLCGAGAVPFRTSMEFSVTRDFVTIASGQSICYSAEQGDYFNDYWLWPTNAVEYHNFANVFRLPPILRGNDWMPEDPDPKERREPRCCLPRLRKQWKSDNPVTSEKAEE